MTRSTVANSDRRFRHAALAALASLGLTGCQSLWGADTYGGRDRYAMIAAPPQYFYVTVHAANADGFVYLGDDIWWDLANGENERRAAMNSSVHGRPIGTGTTVPVIEGVQHAFYPVCGGQIAWLRRVRETVRENGRIVRLSC